MRVLRRAAGFLALGALAGPAAAGSPESGSLYVTQPWQIRRWSPDGTDGAVLAHAPFVAPVNTTVVAELGKTYWYDQDLKRIMRSNVDGTVVESVRCDLETGYTEGIWIEFDPVDGHLFWTEGQSREVWRGQPDGSSAVLLFVADSRVEDVAIDVGARRLYWVTAESSASHTIRRALLDGSQQEVVLEGLDARASSLIVHTAEQRLYWQYSDEIRRSDLDGQDVEVVPLPVARLRPYFASGLALDPNANRMFWISYVGVVSFDLDDMTVDVLHDGYEPNARWIGFDPSSGYVHWSDNSTTYRIYPSAPDVCEILVSHQFPFRIDVDGASGYVYWTAGDELHRMRLDGTDAQRVPVALEVGDFAIDERHARIYWSPAPTMGIWRVNGDGSDAEVVVPEVVPRDVAIDGGNGHLYWTQDAAHGYALMRSDLDGRGSEEVLIQGCAPRSLRIEPAIGFAYWALNCHGGSLLRASMETWQVETIADGIGRVDDLAVDARAGRIYWLRWGPTRLFSADLDGSAVEQVPLPAGTEISAIAVGPHADVPRAGDIDRDGVVDAADLGLILAGWGSCSCLADCAVDLNGDWEVGLADLLEVLSRWG